MNRPLSALFAGIDAFITVAIGVGIPLLVSTLLWAFQFGLAIEWTVFWRVAADIWLLGNGVPIEMTLDPAMAAALGLPGAGEPFVLSMALCGFALITVLLGRRSGVRLATASDHPLTGGVTGLATVSLLAALAAWSAGVDGAQVSVVRAALVVPAVYGAGLLIGALFPGQPASALRIQLGRLVRLGGDRMPRLPPWLKPAVSAGGRLGLMAASGIVAFAAISVTVALLFSFADVISLYEASQSGILGGFAVTVLQLALVPNVVAWAVSWFVGPGFALGAGTLISPLDTHVGLLPNLPILGAVPQDTGIGLVGLLVPLAAAFIAGALVRVRWLRVNTGGIGATLAAAAVGGLLAGALLGVMTLWSAGAAGPGRLSQIGPDAILVAVFAALEVGAGLAAGLLTPLVRPTRGRGVATSTTPRTSSEPAADETATAASGRGAARE